MNDKQTMNLELFKRKEKYKRKKRKPCSRRVLSKQIYFGPRPSATFGPRFLAKSVCILMVQLGCYILDYFWEISDKFLPRKYIVNI